MIVSAAEWIIPVKSYESNELRAAITVQSRLTRSENNV